MAYEALEEALVMILKEESAITDLVADRIRPDRLNQNEVLPAIVYSQTNDLPFSSFSGNENAGVAHYQLDLYSIETDYARLLQLRDLLKLKLHCYTGGTTKNTISLIRVLDAKSFNEPLSKNRRIVMDIEIKYQLGG